MEGLRGAILRLRSAWEGFLVRGGDSGLTQFLTASIDKLGELISVLASGELISVLASGEKRAKLYGLALLKGVVDFAGFFTGKISSLGQHAGATLTAALLFAANEFSTALLRVINAGESLLLKAALAVSEAVGSARFNESVGNALSQSEAEGARLRVRGRKTFDDFLGETTAGISGRNITDRASEELGAHIDRLAEEIVRAQNKPQEIAGEAGASAGVPAVAETPPAATPAEPGANPGEPNAPAPEVPAVSPPQVPAATPAAQAAATEEPSNRVRVRRAAGGEISNFDRLTAAQQAELAETRFGFAESDRRRALSLAARGARRSGEEAGKANRSEAAKAAKDAAAMADDIHAIRTSIDALRAAVDAAAG